MRESPMGTGKALAAGGNGEAHRWSTADSLTAVRIAASICMLFPLEASAFLVLYTLAGVTDALAVLSSLEELLMHLRWGDYRAGRKSIFSKGGYEDV